jgi:hypothetical protein
MKKKEKKKTIYCEHGFIYCLQCIKNKEKRVKITQKEEK